MKEEVSPDDFLLSSLPGLAGGLPTTYRMWSGQLPATADGSRRLFFWLVEKETAPTKGAPLTVWFNGGPGCSSLAGMLTENGPFRPVVPPRPDGTMLEPNYWSWSKASHMLYIESPAGVGFSQLLTPPYVTNDNLTAEWNYQFLQNFVAVFDQYSTADLWLTGESYAGVYIPMLVDRIVRGPNAALAAQLTGFMLGNPVIDCPNTGIIMSNNISLLMSGYFWHALAPYHIYRDFLAAGCMESQPPDFARCQAIFNSVQIGNINGDDLWENYCVGNGTLDITETSPNCVTPDDVVGTYFNRRDVQDAIHAPHVTWTECADVNYTISYADMLGYLDDIWKHRPDLRVLYYSGDVDIATVPFQFTQVCLDTLNPTVVKPWRPYAIPQAPRQVAGYVEVFDKYTYATLRGAGHEAPAYQPASAFYMFTRFLSGQPL